MNLEKLIELSGDALKGQRVESGQQTLGYLADILALADPATPIEWDSGHQFGNDEIKWGNHPAFESDIYSQPAYDYAQSATAHPSCYRGYYSDCTFNCSTEFERSTVGHVLGMVQAAIGRSFSGYKGGVYDFDRGTLVWGGGTSHHSTDSDRCLTGFRVEGDVLVLTTGEDAA